MKKANFIANGRTLHGHLNDDGVLIDFAGEGHNPDDVQWLLPVKPGKVIALALNYNDHAVLRAGNGRIFLIHFLQGVIKSQQVQGVLLLGCVSVFTFRIVQNDSFPIAAVFDSALSPRSFDENQSPGVLDHLLKCLTGRQHFVVAVFGWERTDL